MKKQTIQRPERYNVPEIKVKELRKRAILAASETSTPGADAEGFVIEEG